MGSSLIAGDTKSCGKCVPKHFRDLTNQRFGKLTALTATNKRGGSNNNYVIWECKCDCGNFCEVPSMYLTMGQTKSCGCLGLSFNEEYISKMLKDANIPFESQKTFDNCRFLNNRKALFDFFIDNQYIIEYDGVQHFKYKVNTINTWNTKEHFEETRKNDLLKNAYCFEHNIPLIRIPYTAEYNLNDLKLETTRYLLTPENEEKYYDGTI